MPLVILRYSEGSLANHASRRPPGRSVAVRGYPAIERRQSGQIGPLRKRQPLRISFSQAATCARFKRIVRAFAEIESSRRQRGTEQSRRKAQWPPPLEPTNFRTDGSNSSRSRDWSVAIAG